MFKKTTLLAIAMCASMPLLAQAEEFLTTTNNTDHRSTVMANGVCAGLLPPPFGKVTEPHSTSQVPRYLVDIVCNRPAGSICVANVHMTADCSDKAVAVARFDLNKFSIESFSMTPDGSHYSISASGSTIVINPA